MTQYILMSKSNNNVSVRVIEGDTLTISQDFEIEERDLKQAHKLINIGYGLSIDFDLFCQICAHGGYFYDQDDADAANPTYKCVESYLDSLVVPRNSVWSLVDTESSDGRCVLTNGLNSISITPECLSSNFVESASADVSDYIQPKFSGGYYCRRCGKYVSKSIRPEDNLCDSCHNSFGGDIL